MGEERWILSNYKVEVISYIFPWLGEDKLRMQTLNDHFNP